eukprot:TRINITY_DN121908_c0_g1_i1.p1 TRINITY_DN121908_c0_g1~~TRINITY_DN121908_c0_g1_i1.p1  ORF type:complete len:210 (+),score=23.77 TRINITY_DN121908_c0_g1_i1:169-798(+)
MVKDIPNQSRHTSDENAAGSGSNYMDSDESSPLLGETTTLSTRDWLKACISEWRLSACYVTFCVIVALWCLVLACFMVATHERQHEYKPNPPWFIASDSVIMVFIIVEVFCDMIVLPPEEFWGSLWHLFDLFVCIFCVLTFGIDYATDYGSATIAAHHDDIEFMSFPLFLVRYMAQGFRMVLMLRTAQRAKSAADLVDDTPVIMPPPTR